MVIVDALCLNKDVNPFDYVLVLFMYPIPIDKADEPVCLAKEIHVFDGVVISMYISFANIKLSLDIKGTYFVIASVLKFTVKWFKINC